jgi:hypothetical protein
MVRAVDNDLKHNVYQHTERSARPYKPKSMMAKNRNTVAMLHTDNIKNLRKDYLYGFVV